MNIGPVGKERISNPALLSSSQIEAKLNNLPEDPVLRQNFMESITYYQYSKHRDAFFINLRWCCRMAGWEGEFSLDKAYQIVREADIAARIFVVERARRTGKRGGLRTFAIFADDFDRTVEVLKLAQVRN